MDLLLRADIVRRYLSCIVGDHAATQTLQLLDVGCGSGNVLGKSERFHVTGIDFASAMVCKARHVLPGLTGVVADARRLPFTSGSFDVVTMIGVLEYIPQYRRAVSEIARVLRPGGALVLTVPNSASIFRRLHRLERAATWPLRWLRARLRGDRGASERNPYRQLQWNEPGVRRLLARAHLHVEQFQFCTFGFKTPIFERLPMNLWLCHQASQRRYASPAADRCFGWTLVLQARKKP